MQGSQFRGAGVAHVQLVTVPAFGRCGAGAGMAATARNGGNVVADQRIAARIDKQPSGASWRYCAVVASMSAHQCASSNAARIARRHSALVVRVNRAGRSVLHPRHCRHQRDRRHPTLSLAVVTVDTLLQCRAGRTPLLHPTRSSWPTPIVAPCSVRPMHSSKASSPMEGEATTRTRRCRGRRPGPAPYVHFRDLRHRVG